MRSAIGAVISKERVVLLMRNNPGAWAQEFHARSPEEYVGVVFRRSLSSAEVTSVLHVLRDADEATLRDDMTKLL
jgi:hypothetical protein